MSSTVLTSKGKYFASKCPGNPKNVNSSTEFCVTSFICHAFTLVGKGLQGCRTFLGLSVLARIMAGRL